MPACVCLLFVQVRVAGSGGWWRRFKLSSLAPMTNPWCKPYLVRRLTLHTAHKKSLACTRKTLPALLCYTDPFPDEKNGRPHGTPTRQNSRRSEGGGDRCEWGDRADGGGIGGSGGVLQRRGSAKERTRLLSSSGTQSQP